MSQTDPNSVIQGDDYIPNFSPQAPTAPVLEPEPAANPNPEPTPSAEPTPAPAAAAPAEPTPTLDPQPTPDPAPTQGIDWTKYGVTSEAEFNQKVEYYKTLEAQKAELDQFSKVKERLTNVYANENIAKIDGIVRNTGITDLTVASRLAATKPEELMKTPVQTLAYNQVLKNPDILNYMSMNDVEDGIREKYNISDEEQLPALVKMELAQATKEIANKLSEISSQESNVLSSLLTSQGSHEAQIQERAKAAQTEVGKVVNQFQTLNVEVAGEKFSVAVSPETLGTIKEEAVQFATHYLKGDKEDSQQIASYIQNRLEQVHKAEVFAKFGETMRAKGFEEGLKKVHNGQPITRQDKPGDNTKTADANDYFSASQAHMKQFGNVINPAK